MGSFNRVAEFRKEEHKNKPVSNKDSSHVATDPMLSLLREFWGNNYAHVMLTAEVDSLPNDTDELVQQYGLLGCHSSRNNYLSVHTRIESSGDIHQLWESNAEYDENGHVAMVEVKLGKKDRLRIV